MALATTITNMRGIPLRNPSVGRLHIHNIIRSMEASSPAGSEPSTLADFSIEFQFNPRSDLSSSANALSFASDILPDVYYRANSEIADQIAAFAYNHVSSRGWFYGLSMSVVMETIHVIDEDRRSEGERDDDELLDSSEDNEEDGMMIEEGFEEVNGERLLGMLRSGEGSGDEEGECCCICLEGFIRGAVITSLSPCSHRFHHSCIVQWLHKKPHVLFAVADVPCLFHKCKYLHI